MIKYLVKGAVYDTRILILFSKNIPGVPICAQSPLQYLVFHE